MDQKYLRKRVTEEKINSLKSTGMILYSAELKREVVEWAEKNLNSDTSKQKLAEKIGVSSRSMARWLAKHKPAVSKNPKANFKRLAYQIRQERNSRKKFGVRYSKKLKKTVVGFLEENWWRKSIPQSKKLVAKNLGVSQDTLSRWIKAYASSELQHEKMSLPPTIFQQLKNLKSDLNSHIQMSGIKGEVSEETLLSVGACLLLTRRRNLGKIYQWCLEVGNLERVQKILG